MYLLHGGARSATTRLVSFTQRCRLVSARIGATTICTHKSMSANASSASSHDDEHEATTSQDEALQTPVHRGDGAHRSRGMCQWSTVSVHPHLLSGQAQRRGRGSTATPEQRTRSAVRPAGRGQSVRGRAGPASSIHMGASRHATQDEDPLRQLDPDLFGDADIVPPALDPSRPSVALSIGPYYRAALDGSEQQQRLQAEFADMEARHERARAKRHETSLKWWNEVSRPVLSRYLCAPDATLQNDELPQSLVVPVPKWPDFHPPDVPLLAEEFLSTISRFQYWEAKEATWYTGSSGSAPRDLRKLTKDDLCYRSWGVKCGIGMPGQEVGLQRPDDYMPSGSSLIPT